MEYPLCLRRYTLLDKGHYLGGENTVTRNEKTTLMVFFLVFQKYGKILSHFIKHKPLTYVECIFVGICNKNKYNNYIFRQHFLKKKTLSLKDSIIFFAYTSNFNQNQILNYLLEMSKYKQYRIKGKKGVCGEKRSIVLYT